MRDCSVIYYELPRSYLIYHVFAYYARHRRKVCAHCIVTAVYAFHAEKALLLQAFRDGPGGFDAGGPRLGQTTGDARPVAHGEEAG